MKINRTCLGGLILFWIALLPIVMGQDMVKISRNLESSALEILQSAHSQFQQLAAGSRLSEDDLNIYFNINSFSKSATLLRELVSTGNIKELRGGLQAMVRQAVEIEYLFEKSAGFSRQFESWRNIQTNLASLAQTAGVPYAPLSALSQMSQTLASERRRDRINPGVTMSTAPPAATSGRFRWRGLVDGSDRIVLRGNQVSIEHIAAQQIRDAVFEISSPLPKSSVDVTLRIIKGRGRVEIVEQPSARNLYSVVVLIEDEKSGYDTYEFELTWQ